MSQAEQARRTYRTPSPPGPFSTQVSETRAPAGSGSGAPPDGLCRPAESDGLRRSSKLRGRNVPPVGFCPCARKSSCYRVFRLWSLEVPCALLARGCGCLAAWLCAAVSVRVVSESPQEACGRVDRSPAGQRSPPAPLAASSPFLAQLAAPELSSLAHHCLEKEAFLFVQDPRT